MKTYGCAAAVVGSMVMAASSAEAQGRDKPVIAVFSVRDATDRLTDAERVQLSDYLAIKLVETRAFRVVPRSQLEEVLRKQKRESYRECYDEACQIEIGKELAASHSLALQVLRVGSRCVVAGSLYDLRLQATERAATHKGGCRPEELAESLEQLASSLSRDSSRADSRFEDGEGVGGPSSGGEAVAPPRPAIGSNAAEGSVGETRTPQYKLHISANPRSSTILFDGREQRRGPLRLSVPAGSHQLTVEKPGYLAETLTLDVERDRRVEVELRMDPEHRRTRTEWFGMAVGAYTNTGAVTGGSLSIRLFTLRWGGPYWTLLEGTVGASSGESRSVCAASDSAGTGVCTSDSPGGMGALQTVFGWSISLDGDHRHQLEIMAGIGAFGYSAGAEGAGPLAASPGARYIYHGDHGFSVGIGFRSFISLLERDCPRFGQDEVAPVTEQLECETGRQALFMIDVPFGWSY